ncbi:hypothetical protein Tco_1579456 [Tanacetum coccineum]
MAELATMSEFAFRKRFRSSYQSSPSVSPPDLPSRKRYRGMSELVEDSEEDDDEEDAEIEESIDSNSVSEDAEDEVPTIEDEDPAVEDEGLTTGVKGPGMDDEGYGLDDESRGIDDEGHSGFGSAPESERPERVSAFRQPTLTTWTNLKDGMIYIDIPDYPPPTPPVHIPPSPKWTSGSLLISLSHSDVPSPILSPMVPLIVPSHIATPATAETEYDRDIGELFTRSGAVRDEIFSQRYRFRSLEYEQERVVVTFGAIWRPVLALDAWAGQNGCPESSSLDAISDVHGEN